MDIIGAYDDICLKLGYSGRRPLIEKVLRDIDVEDRFFYLIEAPTGYGKTTLSLSLARYLMDSYRGLNVIHVLPRRTIINDIDNSKASKAFVEGTGR
jgi:CRISPR-associated endonuclease/helicase Cas3